ncbi:MAG: carbamate kinase [Chloroflexi bacterium]|nr:carbamate kinase [Chloroflexota bacterium]
MSRAVVAIGGNSLIKDQDHQSTADQFQAMAETAIHIADLVEGGWEVAITHGNGPQVGFNLLRAEMAQEVLPPPPLDYSGAETQGGLGYIIQQTMGEELARRGIKKAVVTVVTQVVVDATDSAFQNPTKPVGLFYAQAEAKDLIAQKGWRMIEDAGRGWRRVVPSPIPVEIVEAPAIRALLEQGYIVTSVGGGGIPVVLEDGRLRGVEAVIDKDYASSLLARSIKADMFLISTAVEKVALNYGKPDQKFLDRLSLSEAKEYQAQGHFPAGSMGPKIQAALQYLEAGGKEVIITSPENIARALRGETGTHIHP